MGKANRLKSRILSHSLSLGLHKALKRQENRKKWI